MDRPLRVAQPARADTGLAHSAALRWPSSGQTWRALGYALMATAVVLVGLPMYWMLIAAFKTNQEIFTAPPTWIPLAPTFDNFPAAWRQAPFGNFYVNSLIYTLVSGSAKILQAVFSAYAFAFLRFPRKDLVFLLLLMALMIPDEFTVLPNFLTLALVGWTNTYQGLLLTGFSRWNDYLWPLIITNSTEMRTLSVGIALLFQKESGTQWGLVMAGTLYVVLPVLVLFLIVQRHIVEGIAAGAVKG